MLYMITWSRLWLVACHFKNYFVTTYLLGDEQELSLGMLIRLRHIYNFWCYMLDYISVPRVFIIFLYYFGMIYGTKLLTRCPVSVPVFCCLFVSKKLFRKVSRNALKIYGNYFQAKTSPEPEGRLQGAHSHRAPPRRDPGAGRSWGPPGALRHRLVSPLRQ